MAPISNVPIVLTSLVVPDIGKVLYPIWIGNRSHRTDFSGRSRLSPYVMLGRYPMVPIVLTSPVVPDYLIAKM